MKPVTGFCASAAPRIPSRLERTASNNIVINKAMTTRKSVSFHGLSDNMVSSYTGLDFVTKEKVSAGSVFLVSFLLAVIAKAPAQARKASGGSQNRGASWRSSMDGSMAGQLATRN